MADLKAQLSISADASGVEAGVGKAKRSLADLGATASKAGKEASAGLGAAGNGAGQSAQRIDASTRSIIQSIQRTTATLDAGSKTSSRYFEILANQRGVNVASLKPYLDQLDQVNAKHKQVAQTIRGSIVSSGGLGAVFAGSLLAGAAQAAARELSGLIPNLVNSVARFQDLEEKTGASAEALASFRTAADVSGTSIDTIAGLMNRLTGTLSKTDETTKGAGAALKSLGINLADFKKLAPEQQFLKLAENLAKFDDTGTSGAAKVAAVIALLGKSGAEALPFLKELAENGLSKVFTADQIRQADAYADAQARFRSELKQVAEVAAISTLPAITGLSEELTKAAKSSLDLGASAKGLGSSNGIREFAEGATIALATVGESVAFVIKAINQVPASVRAVSADLKFLATVARSAPSDLGDAIRNGTGPVAQALAERNAVVAKSNKELDELLNGNFSRISSGLRERFGTAALAQQAGLGDIDKLVGKPKRPELNFSGVAETASRAKVEVDKVAESLAAANRELALFGQDETFIKAFDLEGLGASQVQLAQYKDTLAQLSALKAHEAINKTIAALAQEREEFGLSSRELAIHRLALQGASSDQLTYADSLLKTVDAQKQAQERKVKLDGLLSNTASSRLEADRQDMLLLKEALEQGQISSSKYLEAVQARLSLLPPEIKEAKDAAEELGLTFASAFEDALVGGKGLREVLDGLAQDISRIVIRKSITEPLANSISGVLGGGNLGSFASIFGGFFADGGSPPMGKVSVVGERGPELFVPRAQGTIVPLQKAGSSDQRPIVVNTNITVPGNTTRATADQIASQAGRAISRALSRGTA